MSDPDRYGRMVRDARRPMIFTPTFEVLVRLLDTIKLMHQQVAAARAEIIAEWVRESGVEEVLKTLTAGQCVCWMIDDGGKCNKCAAESCLARIKAAKDTTNDRS